MLFPPPFIYSENRKNLGAEQHAKHDLNTTKMQV